MPLWVWGCRSATDLAPAGAIIGVDISGNQIDMVNAQLPNLEKFLAINNDLTDLDLVNSHQLGQLDVRHNKLKEVILHAQAKGALNLGEQRHGAVPSVRRHTPKLIRPALVVPLF